MVVANNVQTRSNGLDDRGQPLVTMGGGALPLPMPTQPETLTATRVATKATSTFFIGIPLSFTPRDAHFVPRCTVGRPAEANGSPAPETVGHFKGDLCPWGHSYAACAAKPARKRQPIGPPAPTTSRLFQGCIRVALRFALIVCCAFAGLRLAVRRPSHLAFSLPQQ